MRVCPYTIMTVDEYDSNYIHENIWFPEYTIHQYRKRFRATYNQDYYKPWRGSFIVAELDIIKHRKEQDQNT